MGVGYLTGQGGGGSNIKSMQLGSVTPWNNATTKTLDISITPVDLSKSIVVMHPGYAGIYGINDITSGVLTTETNLQLARNNSTNPTLSIIDWQVIEFYNVKSVQSGSTTGAGETTARNVAISSVDIQKSMIFTSQTVSGTNNSIHRQPNCGATLTTQTNLRIHATNASTTIEWQVIEFK